MQRMRNPNPINVGSRRNLMQGKLVLVKPSDGSVYPEITRDMAGRIGGLQLQQEPPAVAPIFSQLLH